MKILSLNFIFLSSFYIFYFCISGGSIKALNVIEFPWFEHCC